VDEDYSVRRALHTTLYEEGFDVAETASPDDAMSLAQAIRYDAVLLDIGAAGKDGADVCRKLRSLFPRLAILALTVRGDREVRVRALDSGADDCITKPFEMRELLARLRAAVRRFRTTASEADHAIRIGEISLFASRRVVQKAGQPVHLTRKEFDLLEYLMKHSGLPVAHGKLLASVWGPECASQTLYLRTFVRQLRKKLEDDPAEPRYLLTDSHIGYRFVDAGSL
jgi:two-component system KDP operon response regulator KdpE